VTVSGADRRGGVSGATHVAGVIGWPVAHSLSPQIHNAAFAAMDLDWTYVPLAVPPGRMGEALGGLVALGFAGANVTMPHKTDAARLVDERSEDAERLAAVNTIVVGEAGTVGHNTDAPGFDRFLRLDVGFDPAGRTALLFGAGGAARACAVSLGRSGLARLIVALRDAARAEPIRAALTGMPTELDVVGFDDAAGVSADLLVNATPLGAHGESLPLPPWSSTSVAIDLLYRPVSTPLLEEARRAGAVAHGGIGLLLQQAALSFELWTGQPAPLGVMSAAALAALGT